MDPPGLQGAGLGQASFMLELEEGSLSPTMACSASASSQASHMTTSVHIFCLHVGAYVHGIGHAALAASPCRATWLWFDLLSCVSHRMLPVCIISHLCRRL